MSNIISTIQVVKVLNDYTVVINKGHEDGIKLNQRFLIYELDTEPIIDPITKENLGFLENVKGTGVATHIQEHLTTIKSDSYTKPKKRITKSRNMFNLNNDIIEEVLDEPEQLPFKTPGVGNYAKLI